MMAALEALSPGATRSTKGASKQRRDLINLEIDNLKDLLPLPETVRQRLFQLQVMSLVCIYIRKDRYLPHVLGPKINCSEGSWSFDFSKALKGFLVMVTRQGKLLYLSENAADYLGHSVEEIMSQGDSLYDIVDARDHAAVQAELLSGPPSLNLGFGSADEKVLLCRMTLSRVARRQPQYQKFVIIRGRYLHPAEYYQALMNLSGHGPFLHPVFAALCSPLISPETSEALASGSTTIFSSVHNMDMKFLQIDTMAEYHLGYSNDCLKDRSWYTLLHPGDVIQASQKHKQLCDEKETSCILLIRLRTFSGSWLWLHTVLSLREGIQDENVQQIIMATYQMLGDIESVTLQANSWIYHPTPPFRDRLFHVVRSRSEDFLTSLNCCDLPMTTDHVTSNDQWESSDNSSSFTNYKIKRRCSTTRFNAKAQDPTSAMFRRFRHSYSEESGLKGRDTPQLLFPPPPLIPGVFSPIGHHPQMALHSVNLPTPDSPTSSSHQRDASEIKVEIPTLPAYIVPAHHCIGSSVAMLTPDTSPANSSGRSSGGRGCGGGMMLVGHHDLTAGNLHLLNQLGHQHNRLFPATTGFMQIDVVQQASEDHQSALSRPVDDTLPQIEPSSLEDYLRKVEAEELVANGTSSGVINKTHNGKAGTGMYPSTKALAEQGILIEERLVSNGQHFYMTTSSAVDCRAVNDVLPPHCSQQQQHFQEFTGFRDDGFFMGTPSDTTSESSSGNDSPKLKERLKAVHIMSSMSPEMSLMIQTAPLPVFSNNSSRSMLSATTGSGGRSYARRNT